MPEMFLFVADRNVAPSDHSLSLRATPVPASDYTLTRSQRPRTNAVSCENAGPAEQGRAKQTIKTCSVVGSLPNREMRCLARNMFVAWPRVVDSLLVEFPHVEATDNQGIYCQVAKK